MVRDNRSKMEGATVYRELIEFLRRFQNTKVVLPGLDKTVEEFIALLEETYRGYAPMGIFQRRINEAFEGFDALDKERRRVSKLFLELRTMAKKYPEEEVGFPTADESEGRLLRLREEFDQLANKCGRLEGECRNKGIDVDQLDSTLRRLETEEILETYLLYDVNDLSYTSATLGNDVDSRSESISDLEFDIKYQESELSRLRKKKPHRYQDRLTELNGLHDKCLQLEQRLSKEFAEYLSALTSQKAPARPTKAATDYFDEVAKYLGRKLGSIRHIDKVYNVERIDLLKGLVHAEGGTIIRLSDMGTGQSQSAYLLGLLSTNDQRPIIALFDEIAMMDSTSLEPIFRKLNELYDSNRLLAAVMVQRGDEVRVEPIPDGGMR
jgi:exonuclease SbcC